MMKPIFDKAIKIVTAVGLALFIVFLSAGIICGEIHLAFPRLLMMICAICLMAVGALAFSGLVIFLAKPSVRTFKLARKE